MLEAAPRHFFSSDFVLRSSDRDVALLDISSWRERAEFELEGVSHRLYREGFMSGPFVLERAGVIIARALKPSVFRARFELDIRGAPFTLRMTSAFSRHFGIFANDRQVGAIRRAGLFTRRVVLELPPDWSPAIQLFVFWLALVIWNREARSAAS
jgi:hypothetical protein